MHCWSKYSQGQNYNHLSTNSVLSQKSYLAVLGRSKEDGKEVVRREVPVM